jgi:hypothetical protein
MLPNPKGLVLEMEHELNGWTSWLELTRSGEYPRRWAVALLPEDCWECCSSLGLLDEAFSSVKLDEAGERIWLIPAKVFTPLIAACCLC